MSLQALDFTSAFGLLQVSGANLKNNTCHDIATECYERKTYHAKRTRALQKHGVFPDL
uniref:Uncharacterized protein n=1 Tax=Candidozyma auris TaxID=498019 RepID=A0A0L0NU19_CANAR